MTSDHVKFASYVRPFLDTDGAIALNIKTGKYYAFNRAGSQICAYLVRGTCVRDLINIIEREFDIPREIATEDIHKFLQNLHLQRLVDIEKSETKAAACP
jgi:hypothetical protein